MRLGATPIEKNKTEFVVWAPLAKHVFVEILDSPVDRIQLEPDEFGYYKGTAPVGPGACYRLHTNDHGGRPDPASRYQPEGVHGPSAIVDTFFDWQDHEWRGIPLKDYVIYELHVGTFTEQGTFDAAIGRLDYLVDLGATAIELMPVAQFPGERNWGYDGVLPYAVHNSYGGPAALKRLVNAAHQKGLAVILDVVYNHLGPEGNYIGEFAPLFTDKYHTPWGPAVNVDGEHSDGVRHYFIENAVEWIRDYHIDALRLDAVHGILDTSAQPFLAELSDAVHNCVKDRPAYLIAESDLNDVRMIRPIEEGGLGMDAQWLDDFHHSVHALITGEASGYYADYGELHHFATTLRQGFIFTGNYSAYRKRRHGNKPVGTRGEQFVVCVQNHDQIGNRMLGDRLAALVDHERLKLAAACLLLSPFVPLLFMGEEYGERRPFPYFIHHSNKSLVDAVRKGRREEFKAFSWKGEPPDPQAVETFLSARVDPTGELDPRQSMLRGVYKELLRLRKSYNLGPGTTEARDVIELDVSNTIVMNRLGASVIFCFAEQSTRVDVPLPRGEYEKVFCTASHDWCGPGDNIRRHITSPGSINMELPPMSATLLATVTEA